MKNANRLIALLLSLLLLFGLAPLAYAAGDSAEAESPGALSALQKIAAQEIPYELPPEAEGAARAELTLLQNGNLEAQWPARSFQAQSAAAENAFVAALERFEPSIDLTSYRISVTELSRIFENTINTRPELFYIESIYYYVENNYATVVYFGYTHAISVIRARAILLDAVVEFILDQVPDGLLPIEKVLWVNEYLALNAEYIAEPNSRLWPQQVYSVYGILVEGVGVCQGYALSNILLLDRLGVPCIFITSPNPYPIGMNHGWNLVQLDGQWYHVDTTWNDAMPAYNGSLDYLGHMNHNYLLLSSTAISKDHWGYRLPSGISAASTIYDNYFWRKTSSALSYLDGKWYYFEDNTSWKFDTSGASISYRMMRYDFSDNTNEFEIVLNCSQNRPASTSKFISSRFTPSLAVYDGLFYINDGNSIFSVDIIHGADEGYPLTNLVTESTLNLANYQSIGGFAVQKNKIRYFIYDYSSAQPRYILRDGPALGEAPELPAAPKSFSLEPFSVELRYRSTVQLKAAPGPVRWESDDKSLVTVDPNGNLRNMAFGEEGETLVWAFNDTDGSYSYCIVFVYTDRWQWIIWIFLLGFLWY
ncbi:MAG: hypothetical protein FWH26_09960 [Oscillospiraceae bacterium]|nr:hypothetical protein [Oscillospiraceae bacterium]